MDPSKLQPGDRLDRYEVLCPLAYGGMASVWLARFGGRLGFERLVVVKMILPQYSQDPAFQTMFLDEARIASRIEHSNVARILDVGDIEGNYYMVMEWVDGDSLSKVLRGAEVNKVRVPPGIAMRIVADAAAGLHAAHSLKDRDGSPLGVVHRDVSPQNLLIANSGATMLIDFGVAKARDRVSAETSVGQLKGKVRYMAPEQACGRRTDHRADVWALGAITYELFAGTPPFHAANEMMTLERLASGEAPPPLPASVPEPVRAVIERAIAMDPDARYATALELSQALEAAMVQIGEPTSMAMVAHYTGHLLAERKAARRRAVEAALTKAGVAGEAPPPPIATHETPSRSHQGHASHAGHAGQTPNAYPQGAPPPWLAPGFAPGPSPSQPSFVSHLTPPHAAFAPPGRRGPHESHAMGFAEAPSTASTTTLGSAAMEYPQALDDARRRRFMGVFLGLSITIGLIGTVLIATSAMHRRAARASAASTLKAPSELAGGLPPPAAVSIPPPTTSAQPKIPSSASPPKPAGKAPAPGK